MNGLHSSAISTLRASTLALQNDRLSPELVALAIESAALSLAVITASTIGFSATSDTTATAATTQTSATATTNTKKRTPYDRYAPPGLSPASLSRDMLLQIVNGWAGDFTRGRIVTGKSRMADIAIAIRLATSEGRSITRREIYTSTGVKPQNQWQALRRLIDWGLVSSTQGTTSDRTKHYTALGDLRVIR